MREFYINVKLRQGFTWIQVDEVPPEGWKMPGIPAFVIEYETPGSYELVTVQLEKGTWYDQHGRSSEENTYLRYLEEGPDDDWDTNYQSPLSPDELSAIGDAISRYMVVALSAYTALFYPQFRNSALN